MISKRSIETPCSEGAGESLTLAEASTVSQCRDEVVELVATHLETHNDDWTTLPVVLKKITSTYSIKQLFTIEQQNPATFQREEKCVAKKLTREAVGKDNGRFHLAFFALASGFRGCPHHHAKVNCVSAVLGGPFTEVTYAVEMREKGSVTLDLADANSPQYAHSIGNFHRQQIAYSLHVYGAPKGVNFNTYYDAITNPDFIQAEAEKQIAAYTVTPGR
jgi:hypothetical protein